eukprot:scaffold1228_cov246-Pinguiococcus_pyrenoidosus.AAC.5
MRGRRQPGATTCSATDASAVRRCRPLARKSKSAQASQVKTKMYREESDSEPDLERCRATPQNHGCVRHHVDEPRIRDHDCARGARATGRLLHSHMAAPTTLKQPRQCGDGLFTCFLHSRVGECGLTRTNDEAALWHQRLSFRSNFAPAESLVGVSQDHVTDRDISKNIFKYIEKLWVYVKK